MLKQMETIRQDEPEMRKFLGMAQKLCSKAQFTIAKSGKTYYFKKTSLLERDDHAGDDA